jgi:aquaporin Z
MKSAHATAAWANSSDVARIDSMRWFAAEAFGTFCLVFAGTGAIIVNDQFGHAVTHVGIALTFGLVILAMIYALGDVSGCHLNPAVTIGFFVSGRFAAGKVVPYIVAQCVGGILASVLLRLMFPAHPTLGATVPSGVVLQSWTMEFILTWMLMVVILGVSTGPKETGVLAGVAIGSVIGLEAMFGGPVSGASMNPARSLAPAAVARQFDHLWLYVTAPIAGALVGVATSAIIYGRAPARDAL